MKKTVKKEKKEAKNHARRGLTVNELFAKNGITDLRVCIVNLKLSKKQKKLVRDLSDPVIRFNKSLNLNKGNIALA